MKKQKEQNIFMFWSISYLKSLYFKKEIYLIDRSKDEIDIKKTSITYKVNNIKHSFRKSLKVFENELEIFKKISIKTLKSEYYESVGNV